MVLLLQETIQPLFPLRSTTSIYSLNNGEDIKKILNWMEMFGAYRPKHMRAYSPDHRGRVKLLAGSEERQNEGFA